MAEQIHQNRDRTERADEPEATEDIVPIVESDVDLAATDALLEEIDGILEENPEDFMRTYQQRGGE